MKRTIVLLLALVVLSGCTQWQQWTMTPRKSYLAVSDSFTITVRTLTRYKTAGVFDEKETKAIGIAIDLANAALDDWDKALRTGQNPDFAESEFRKQIAALLASIAAAERRTQ